MVDEVVANVVFKGVDEVSGIALRISAGVFGIEQAARLALTAFGKFATAEQNMVRIANATNLAKERVKEIYTELERIAGKHGGGMESLNKALRELVARTGQKDANVTGVLEDIAKAAKIGGVEIEDLGTVAASTFANMNIPINRAKGIMSGYAAQMEANFGSFAAMMPRISTHLGVLKLDGQKNLDSVATMAQAITEKGGSANTTLQTMDSILGSITTNSTEWARTTSVTTQKLIDQGKSFTDLMIAISDFAEKQGALGADVWGRAQAARLQFTESDILLLRRIQESKAAIHKAEMEAGGKRAQADEKAAKIQQTTIAQLYSMGIELGRIAIETGNLIKAAGSLVGMGGPRKTIDDLKELVELLQAIENLDFEKIWEKAKNWNWFSLKMASGTPPILRAPTGRGGGGGSGENKKRMQLLEEHNAALRLLTEELEKQDRFRKGGGYAPISYTPGAGGLSPEAMFQLAGYGGGGGGGGRTWGSPYGDDGGGGYPRYLGADPGAPSGRGPSGRGPSGRGPSGPGAGPAAPAGPGTGPAGPVMGAGTTTWENVQQSGYWKTGRTGEGKDVAPAETTGTTPVAGIPGAAAAVDDMMNMVGLNENEHREKIRQYLKTGGRGMDPKDVPWCAAFVGSALAQHGIKGTGSDVATSYMNWGQGVSASGVQKGDVIVRPQGAGPGQSGGHVGMATGRVDPKTGKIEMVSGNTVPVRGRHQGQVQTTWEDPRSIVVRRSTQPLPAAPAATPAATTPAATPAAPATGIAPPAGGPSEAIMDFIKSYEADPKTGKAYTKPYWDVKGYTIGYGTGAKGRKSITEKEADAEVRSLAKKAYDEISTKWPKLTQGQKDALVSLHMNTGFLGKNEGNHAKLKAALDKGDLAGARAVIANMHHINPGTPQEESVPGLKTRRDAELLKSWDLPEKPGERKDAGPATTPAPTTKLSPEKVKDFTKAGGGIAETKEPVGRQPIGGGIGASGGAGAEEPIGAPWPRGGPRRRGRPTIHKTTEGERRLSDVPKAKPLAPGAKTGGERAAEKRLSKVPKAIPLNRPPKSQDAPSSKQGVNQVLGRQYADSRRSSLADRVG